MKLEIMGFSQKGLMDLGLDVDDAVLLRWFVDFQGTQKMVSIPNPEDGKLYFWVNFKKVCKDLPLITKSDRWMSERFNKLVSLGILSKFSSGSAMGKISAFRISENDKYLSLVSMSVNTDMGAVNTDMAMSVKGDMLSNTNSLPSNINTSDSKLSDKGASATTGKKPSDKNEVEEFLSGDPDLRDAFKAFLEMRSKIRKPMTDYAKMLLIKRLKGLSSDSKDWVAMLNQSTQNSWQSVFPLHDDGRKKDQVKPTRTPVSNSAFDNQEGGEFVW